MTVSSWLMKSRFAALSLVIFGVMCLHTRNGQWIGDFWEHSAVVRELSTHILNPRHPQLLLEVPHAFYSPYAVTVALFARTLHSDAVTALAIAGLINLGLFFFGLRLFVYSIRAENQSATAFYALLLTLFCWGSDPWPWSGFFHIGVLGYVLPYPSTFAGALSLIALGVNRLRIETKRQIWLVLILLIAVTVLISHPTTFLFLGAGLVSQSFAEKDSVFSEIVLVGSLLSVAFLMAAFWPYFPILRLFSDASTSMRDVESQVVYSHVLSRIWPSLVGLPLVIARARSNWRHPLVLMLVFMSGIYVLGAISGRYSYGRVLPYIVLVLHVQIAETLSSVEHRIQDSNWLLRLSVSVSVIFLSLFLSGKALKETLGYALHERLPTYEPYRFLSRFTNQYDVVLSDINSSWIVPTFGGKIVAAYHPLAFVPDQEIRKFDLDRFFKEQASFSERQRIIRKYQAHYLLLSKSLVNWKELEQSFMSQGRVVYESDNFVLVSLKPNLD